MSRNEAAIKEAAEKLKAPSGSQKCFAARCDIRKTDEIGAAVGQVLQKFGGIDILINGDAGNPLAGFDNLPTNAPKAAHEIDTMGAPNVIKCVYTKWMGGDGGGISLIYQLLYIILGQFYKSMQEAQKQLLMPWPSTPPQGP